MLTTSHIRWLAAVWFFGGAAAAMPASAAAPALGLIVKLKPAAADPADAGRKPAASAQDRVQDRVHKALRSAGLEPAHAVHAVGRDMLRLDFARRLSTQDARAAARALEAAGEVQWAEPNTIEPLAQAAAVPDDPLFKPAAGSGQWWLRPAGGANGNAIDERLRGVPGVQTAWQRTTGGPSPVVAVLDTGLAAHPELSGRTLPGHDFVSEVDIANDGNGRDADPSDPGDWVSQADLANPLFKDCEVAPSSWHGTIIAGLLAAQTNNAAGVAALNWDGRVLPVRVGGKCGAPLSDIIDGMRWAAGLPVDGAPANANPARVLNISFGGSAACGNAYQDTINELAALGVVIVAAAGNGPGAVKRPASCQGAVGVAALNRDGFKATYSNFGPGLVVGTVGGDPPDEGLWGELLGDPGLLTITNLGAQSPAGAGYAGVYGTSFSTPVAAGAAALMFSVNPALGVAQVIDGLKRSARPHVTSGVMPACSNEAPGRCLCSAATCGAGMLDIDQALVFAANPAGYVPPAASGANIDAADVINAVKLGPDRAALAPPPAPSGGDGGGGALGAGGLLALAVAAAAAAASRLRRERARQPAPGAATQVPKGRPRI
jgi:serine protease